MSSKKYAAIIAIVALAAGLTAWFADPIWRVLAVAVLASLCLRFGPRVASATANGDTQDSEPPLRIELLGLFDDLARENRDELHASHGDLDRVKALLRHAIDELVQRFGEMNTHIQAQHHLVQTIVAAIPADARQTPATPGGRAAEAARQIDTHARQVTAGVNAAVTALQFQDLTSQLIGHAQQRILNIDSLVPRLADSLRQPMPLADGLRAARGWLREHARHEAQRGHPIRQESMRSGDIELF